MSFLSERVSLEGRFNSNWSTTTIDWGNADFDPPNDAAWVRFSILNGASQYRAFNKKRTHTGIISVQIFSPATTGTHLMRGYADTIAAIFDGKEFDDIACASASIETIGTDGIWHQINVNIAYRRED